MYQTKTYFQEATEVKVPISPFLIFFRPEDSDFHI